MSNEIYEIKPGFGLGNIEFGSTRDEVKMILGKPDEIETYDFSEEGDDASEVWHYDEYEMSLEFNEEFDWQLISFAVSGEDFKLKGERFIGKSKEAAMELIEEMDLGDTEEETTDEVDMIAVPELNLSFWFEEDELSEIQWGPIFETDN